MIERIILARQRLKRSTPIMIPDFEISSNRKAESALWIRLRIKL